LFRRQPRGNRKLARRNIRTWRAKVSVYVLMVQYLVFCLKYGYTELNYINLGDYIIVSETIYIVGA
jgi:hypothetical protein